MLNESRKSTILAVIGISALLLVAFLAAYSGGQNLTPTKYIEKTCDAYCYEKGETKDNNDSQFEVFWNWTTKDSVSFYTFILAIFTGLLAGVSMFQGYFLYRADLLGRESLASVQMAFVFIRTFETSVVNDNFIIAPLWENSGATPAEDKTMWASWRHFETEPTQDFYLFDWVVDGWLPAGSRQSYIGFIAPHAVQYAPPLILPTGLLEMVALKHGKIFIWGWIEYRDVFSKKRTHRTEFCSEVLATYTGDDPGGNKTIHTRFPIYGPYNTAK
jgi:hypothetical protein